MKRNNSHDVKVEALTSSDFEQRITKPKILLFDIETAPNLSYVWGHYEQNVLAHVEQKYMLSFAWKWLGEKTTYVRSLPDYKGYKPGKADDRKLAKDLWDLFDEADIIIGHNLDSFDIKVANARFIVHEMPPPGFYRTVDTKKVAKRAFRFNSNKLDDLGNTLGVGRKMKHQGFDLWAGCLMGDTKCWDTMCRYNKQDVVLLEKVYLKLRQWAPSHPNLNVVMNRDTGCAKCGSNNTRKRGFAWTNMSRAQRFECLDCGGYSQGKYTKVSTVRSQ